MSTKDTGGPAFPEIGNVGHNSDWQSESGMTLRDYFAAKVSMPAEFSVDWAEHLADRKRPDNVKDHCAWVQFWADAEAAYRYLHADAMIRARSA